MRSICFAGLLVAGFATWSCGGGSSSTPSGPTQTGNTTVINILGQLATKSYSPNPTVVAQGGLMAWHNNDTVTHHIVANDGSFDAGFIAPGATSQAIPLGTNGANYHCSIHPTTMNFGSITTAADMPAPPCQGQYC